MHSTILTVIYLTGLGLDGPPGKALSGDIMKYILMDGDSGEKKKESPKDKIGGKGKQDVEKGKSKIRYDNHVL